MKFQIAFLVLVCSIFCTVYSQDEVVGPVPLLQCFVGNAINGTGNVTLMQCATNEDTCQTKIEIRDGSSVLTWKECKPADVCENNAQGNKKECYSDEAKNKGLRVCFSCCNTVACNDGDEIPPEGPGEE